MIQEDYHADSATFKMTSLKSEHEIRLSDCPSTAYTLGARTVTTHLVNAAQPCNSLCRGSPST